MSRKRQKSHNQKVAEIARKGVELSIEDADYYLERTERDGGDIVVGETFMRDFAMAYLQTKNAYPEEAKQTITYRHPSQNGIFYGYHNKLSLNRRPGGNKENFQQLYNMFRHFEYSGPIRKPSEIEGRLIGECALAFLQVKLGEKWFSVLKESIIEMHKKSHDPFNSGYASMGANTGVKLKFSGEELLVALDFKNVTYKNSTLSMSENALPETLKMAMVGKSLKEIFGEVVANDCLERTVAVGIQKTYKSFTVKFDEKRVRLKAA